MVFRLYDATVARFKQGVKALKTPIAKAQAHCMESGETPALETARLHATMHALPFQILSVRHHSLHALEGVEKGEFVPPMGLPQPETLAAMMQHLEDTLVALEAWTPERVDALQSRDVVFRIGEREMPFIGVNFLMSFSLPNFYFHTTTAYNILRNQGVELGKRDYLGTPELKQ